MSKYIYGNSYPCFLLETVLVSSILVTLTFNIQLYNANQYPDLSPTFNIQ